MSIVHVEAFKIKARGFGPTPTKPSGPVIIGQDTPSLAQSFERMNLKHQDYSPTSRMAEHGPYRSVVAGLSYTDRKESLGIHTPSPLIGLGHGQSVMPSLYSPSSWTSSANAYGVPSPMWSPYSPGAIGQERNPSTPSQQDFYAQQRQMIRANERQPADFANAGHNIVDIDRIRAGLDVRTTVPGLDLCSKNQLTLMLV